MFGGEDVQGGRGVIRGGGRAQGGVGVVRGGEDGVGGGHVVSEGVQEGAGGDGDGQEEESVRGVEEDACLAVAAAVDRAY